MCTRNTCYVFLFLSLSLAVDYPMKNIIFFYIRIFTVENVASLSSDALHLEIINKQHKGNETRSFTHSYWKSWYLSLVGRYSVPFTTCCYALYLWKIMWIFNMQLHKNLWFLHKLIELPLSSLQLGTYYANIFFNIPFQFGKKYRQNLEYTA